MNPSPSPAFDGTPAIPFRFHFVQDLATGSPVGLMIEHRQRFDDRVRFGEHGLLSSPHDVGAPLWLAERIERAAFTEALAPAECRPIHVPAPDAAFEHPDTPVACRAAVARTPLLAQEFCIEFSDAAFSLARGEATWIVRGFRRRGFRVGIDLTRSQAASLSPELRLMLDTVRVRAIDLDEETVDAAVSQARDSGISVIVDAPRWRDSEALIARGLTYALAPRADA
jgi:hypothetical protein